MDNTKDTPIDYKQFEGATPGPWRTNAIYSRVVNDDLEICEVAVNHKEKSFSYDEWRANSRLLAAAPDLLKENKELKLEVKNLMVYKIQAYEQLAEIESLKLELQKQKELNAELVSAYKYLKGTLTSDRLKCEQPNAIEKLESLIKKSNEI